MSSFSSLLGDASQLGPTGNEDGNGKLIEEVKLAAKSFSVKTPGFKGLIPDFLHAVSIISLSTESAHAARYSFTTSG